MKNWLSIIIYINLIIYSYNAFSQQTDQVTNAQQSLERGEQLFEIENFEGALHEFRQAYKLTNYWEILYNIGICHKMLNNNTQAAETLEQYLEQGRGNLSQQDVSEVEAKIQEIRDLIALQEQSQNNEQQVTQQNQINNTKNLESNNVSENLRSNIQLVIIPNETEAIDHEPPVYKKWWFWTTIVGVLIIGAGVGTTFAVINFEEDSDYDLEFHNDN